MTAQALQNRGVYLTNGADADPPLCRAACAGGRLDAVDLYAFDDAGFARSLAGYAAVLLPIHVDQRLLSRRRAALEAWLDGGGTLVVNGHVAHMFLNGLTPFVPLERPSLSDFAIAEATPHRIFAGVDRHDLTFRRGVAGFYGRGHNPPPPGAVVLNTLGPDRVPVDWLWRRPGGGRVFMHSGNNIWMYLTEDSTAARLPGQLVDWALDGGNADG